jgi:hypothetical protein
MEEDDAYIPKTEVRRILGGISHRQCDRHVDAGRIPRPVYLFGRPLWLKSALLAHLAEMARTATKPKLSAAEAARRQRLSKYPRRDDGKLAKHTTTKKKKVDAPAKTRVRPKKTAAAIPEVEVSV